MKYLLRAQLCRKKDENIQKMNAGLRNTCVDHFLKLKNSSRWNDSHRKFGSSKELCTIDGVMTLNNAEEEPFFHADYSVRAKCKY